MPDGAQPCIGFTQLESKTRAIATIAADVRLIPSARLAAIVLTLHGGWLTRIDIANRCGVHDRTISRIIARLVELGMVVADWPEGSQVRVYRWKGNAPDGHVPFQSIPDRNGLLTTPMLRG